MVFLQKKRFDRSGPSSLLYRIEKIIHEHGLLHQADKVIVGVSGGSDSIALLHLLHALGWELQLVAVYIDHGLRPDEMREEKLTIKEQCRRLHIPFISKLINVRGYAANTKRSIEEAGRILRHEALEKIRADQHASVIALAHTSDDQVEEFFIRLMRGTSLKGLSGMQLKRDRIIRPLLREPKTTLINYLNKTSTPFCHDSTNFDRTFLRNRIRLDLLPVLENEFNPSIRKTILQNMDILAHDEAFLEEISRDAFEACVPGSLLLHQDTKDTNTGELILLPGPLTGFHHAIQCRVIERCFWLLKIKPGYIQIRSLLRFTQTAENGAELHLADGVRVTRSINQIVLSRPLQQGQFRGSAPVDTFKPRQILSPGNYTVRELGKILKLSVPPAMTDNISNQETLLLDLDKITFPLLLRPPEPGERFRPYNAPGKKKIFRYLAEKKIAMKKRHGYPVLISDGKVIALPGLQISHEVRVTKATNNRLRIELIDINR